MDEVTMRGTKKELIPNVHAPPSCGKKRIKSRCHALPCCMIRSSYHITIYSPSPTGTFIPCIPRYPLMTDSFQSFSTSLRTSSTISKTSTRIDRHVLFISGFFVPSPALASESELGSVWCQPHALRSPPGHVDSAQRSDVSAKKVM